MSNYVINEIKGEIQTLFNVENPQLISNNLNEQMKPWLCKNFVSRGLKFNPLAGNWDSENSVFIYGRKDIIKKIYDDLYDTMLPRLSEQFNEHVGIEYPRYLSMFESLSYDVSVIIAGGKYNKNKPEIINFINELENVTVGTMGSYSPYKNSFFENLTEISNAKVATKERVEDITKEILSEVYSYWNTHQIQTKKDRMKKGYKHIDKIIKN